MWHRTLRNISVFSALALLSACALFDTPQSADENRPLAPAAAVASAHPLATQAGMDVLAKGGNAFDAAIAVAASLGVVEPYSAGIGGGGFWLLYEADKDQYRFIDARETAPQAADEHYYLTSSGKVDRDKAINGPTAAGIPGQVAAFSHIAEHYGRLPLKTTLADAIEQAEQGFAIDDHYRTLMRYRLDAVRRYPDSAKIFLDNNQVPEAGHVLRQKELAETLKAVAKEGSAGFYQGEVAKQLVAAVQHNGGHWTAADLANYRVIERDPIRVNFGGLEVVSAPPPSSGGIALVQMLNMLTYFQWQTLNPVDQTHLLTEVMRRAYLDRAEFLGDPDFISIPQADLLSEKRAQFWASSINMDRATSSLSLKGPKNIEEGFHTTHFSVLDKAGNKVSATLSINLPFGSAFTAAGTGVLLNNEMDDFSAKPGEPNAYGLVGNKANAIAPGKRPLSSMTPTIINSAEQAAILGTPGGSRIISMVFLGVLEHLQQKPVNDWVARPRFHHQYLPDVLEFEPNAFTPVELEQLSARGHSLKNTKRTYGNMQAILWDKENQRVTAASDPRGIGQAVVDEKK